MTPEFPGKHLLLLRHGPVPVQPTPPTDHLQGTAKPVYRGSPLDDPTVLERSRPVVGKAEKGKGSGRLSSPQRLARRPKQNQTGLLRMQGKPVFTEPLRQHTEHPSRIFLKGEHQDSIVSVPDEERPTPKSRLDHILEPHVQHIVKIDVCQKRRHHPALGSTSVWVHYTAILEHSRLQPLVDCTSKYTVTHPLVEKTP
jgi:hypothetical protein